MEINKENTVKLRIKSKIPLPLEPLPALSQKLLKRHQDTEMERHPLKTINGHQNNNAPTSAGSSQKIEKVEQVKSKSKRSLKIDNRYVTVRPKTEQLDSGYKVFKDDIEEESSIITISDDDEESVDERKCKEMRYFIKNYHKSCLGEAGRAVTPVLKSPSLEPSRVRNIKRSLKRPHSRELQGLSPTTEVEKGEERHKRRLDFNVNLNYTLTSPDFWEKAYMKCLTRDYAPDLFSYLLDKEDQTLRPKISSVTRACVINWLIKVNGPVGNPAVVQTAIWYFDAVLSVGYVQMHKLQLLAAACYWIAQKIHGPTVSSKRLVKCASHAFTSTHLMDAEKAVLNKLKFPSQPILPQEFIPYLSWCCDSSYPRETELAATFICMAGLMVDKSVCVISPSVIAAAAVKNAVLLLMKKNSLAKLQTNPVFKAAEKKTQDISVICSIQRNAVRLLSSPFYEYRALMEYFGSPPHFIAQKIVAAANKFAVADTRTENC